MFRFICILLLVQCLTAPRKISVLCHVGRQSMSNSMDTDVIYSVKGQESVKYL